MSEYLSLIAGGITLAVGVLIVGFGFFCMSAGKGGYGHGPLPFIKQPTEWGLIGVGLGFVALGYVIISVAVDVIQS